MRMVSGRLSACCLGALLAVGCAAPDGADGSPGSSNSKTGGSGTSTNGGGTGTGSGGISTPDAGTGVDNTPLATTDGTYTVQTFFITAKDGTQLQATAWRPHKTSAGKLAAVVFVNSWAFGMWEYTKQAEKFAADGYVVLSYMTRGFGKSGGQVEILGPNDLADVSSAFDWLMANTDAAAGHIGMGGISYGGGMTIRALASEPRISAGIALSGFSDLGRALHQGDTPRLAWGLILIGSGYLTGSLDPTISTLFEDMLHNQNMDQVDAFDAPRSAINYLDQINAQNKPLYLSNNLEDDLFSPDATLDFYAKLTTPKKLDLSRGTHAQAELPGLLGIANYPWDQAKRWLDHYLRGAQNGIEQEPKVSIEPKFSGTRVALSGWPARELTQHKLYMDPRGLFSAGKLQAAPTTDKKNTDVFASGIDTIATSGIPVLSNALTAQVGNQVHVVLDLVNRADGATYRSDALIQDTTLAGPSNVHVRVSSSSGQALVVAYLYDVGAGSVGTLLANGAVTVRTATDDSPEDADIELPALLYTVPAGHKLAVAVDTVDMLYAPPGLLPREVKLHFDGAQAPSFTYSVY